MTDLLTTRMPLQDKPQLVSEADRVVKLPTTFVNTSQAGYYIPQQQQQQTISMFKENHSQETVDSDLTERAHSAHSVEDHAALGASTTGFHTTTSSYMQAGGFRYQIRRPVESWKFVETRKLDGSVIFLCRFCGSSYKHKKSLNKHWKDKHADVPRPHGAQADDDEDDEEDEVDDEEEGVAGVEEGDGSDKENRPPEHVTSSNTVSVHPSGRNDLTPIGAHSDFMTGVKQCESTQRLMLSERAALRRLSAPMNRSIERSVQHRRTSFLPDTRQPANARPTNLMPLKRRFRDTFDSAPNRLNMPATRVESVQDNKYQEPNTKRRQSMLTSEEMVLTTGDSSHPRIANEQTYRSLDRIRNEGSSFINDQGDDENVTVPGCTQPESQPLDLSILRPTESPQVQPPKRSQSPEIPKAEPINNKVDQSIDVTLLIGLLQTALNTLTAEFREATRRSGEGLLSTSNLSKTSVSLLLAIGTLLVSVVDRKSVSDSRGGSMSPKSDETRGEVGVEKTHRHSGHTPPNTPILPPAPSSALVSPAIEPHMFHLDDHKSRPEPRSYSNHPDLVRTPPLNRSLHSFEAAQAVTPKADDRVTPNNVESFTVTSTGTMETFNSSFTPVRLARAHMKSNPTVAPRTPSTDSASKPSRQSDDPKYAGESVAECQIICPVCNFDARWFSELRAHMVNHSEHRMFGCCFCTYRAKWKWDVAKHMRRCPLGRHVAHLSNEALLRIVRYHPPPKGNILYNYFPQDGFPGVGLDRPPTPPNADPLLANRGRVEPNAFRFTTGQNHHAVVQGSVELSPSADDPPLLTRQTSLSPNSEALHEGEVDPDHSPQPLIIVDDVDPTGLKPETNEAVFDANHAMLFRSQMMGSQKGSEIAQTGLVFKLRKCAHCTFHCIDEREYQQHVQTHCRPGVTVTSNGETLLSPSTTSSSHFANPGPVNGSSVRI